MGQGERVLVTGATGYVASRLIPALLERGFAVRATSRHPEPVAKRHPQVETAASDVFDRASLVEAMRDIDVAFYLVHSMAGADFKAKDKEAAENFASAAAEAGVRRIVYLGGLGSSDDELSEHLTSRHETGEVLAAGDVQVIELRAAIVVGSGSAAFEMLRHLTERLPMMIAPRWLSTRIQPIAERDLVAYLIEASLVDVEGNRIVEVGGADVLTYREMIKGYARERGIRRAIIGVPVLTPRLSSYWVHLVTPISSSIAQPLIDGLRNEVIVTDDSAKELLPSITPVGYREAVRSALQHQVDELEAESAPGKSSVAGSLEGFLIERNTVASDATAQQLTGYIGSVGGDPRWYPLRWTWWVRARLDDLFGGAGLRWHRPPAGLHPGVSVDWWTVEDVGHDRLLLRAEMKTPGEAWLEWRVGERNGGSELRQIAYFRPRGLLGYLYWYLLYPFHTPIFRLMARRIAQRAASYETSGSAA